MCGEHELWLLGADETIGSSPLVRGTPLRGRRDEGDIRIIPACAGNTSPRAETRYWPGDHPRLCGEHSASSGVSGRYQGSSPLVRGTQSLLPPGLRGPGIIPACAGNTYPLRARAMVPRDHPRLCGEHLGSGTTDALAFGSSPLVRGTQRVGTGVGVRFRIIPACAGNTVP